MVQSRRLHRPAQRLRLLRQPRPRFPHRPGIAAWDFSTFKDTAVTERARLQFRAEFFNILNRTNFNTPNLVVFTPSGVSPTAGIVTSTSTTSRQIQFGAKLLW